MRHTRYWSVIVLCLFLVSVSVHAQKAKEVAVTSYLEVPLDTAAPVILGDAQGPYVNALNGVKSVLQSGGEWELDVPSSSSRRIFLDYGAAGVPGNAMNLPGRFVTKCFAVSARTVASLTRANPVTECPLALRYDDDTGSASIYYRLALHEPNRPGTEHARFECTGFATNDSCVQWTVTPADELGRASGNPDGRSTARLLRITEARRSISEEEIGDFPMNFRFVITKP